MMTIEELESQRQALALDVEEGKPGAAKELERVETEIARVKREAERSGLAEKERGTRATREEAQRQKEQRHALETQLGQLRHRRQLAAREVEVAVEQLVAALRPLVEVGREMYVISAQLGRPRVRLMLEQAISWYLNWKLSAVVPGIDRPSHDYRKPLHELLGERDAGDASSEGAR